MQFLNVTLPACLGNKETFLPTYPVTITSLTVIPNSVNTSSMFLKNLLTSPLVILSIFLICSGVNSLSKTICIFASSCDFEIENTKVLSDLLAFGSLKFPKTFRIFPITVASGLRLVIQLSFN